MPPPFLELRTWSTITVLLLCWCQAARGQVERYELGKRLQRFEIAWDAASDEQRARSTPCMQNAVKNFFSLALLEAARNLDQAWMATRDANSPPIVEGIVPFRLDLPTRIVPETSTSVVVSLQRFYDSETPSPRAGSVEWRLYHDHQETLLASSRVPWDEATLEFPIPLGKLPSGDYRIQVTFHDNDVSFDLPTLLFSRIADLDSRLERLEARVRDRESPLNDSVRGTVRDHLALIKQTRRDSSIEIDYPFHRILSLDEALIADNADVPSLLRAAATEHDVWLSITDDRKRVPVRIRFPEPSPEQPPSLEPRPVLFLLHGAGGSENMFFETYGAGGYVKQGLERGWIVIAPRQGITGLALDCQEMVTVLESLLPVDRNQVYIAGHSMGAAQAIRQVRLHPDLPRAVAVLGGGAAVGNAEEISSVPWYVAAGELDFGRGGARAFFESMQKANAGKLICEDFPQVEHMVIVQAAGPAVFRFFDHVRTQSQATAK